MLVKEEEEGLLFQDYKCCSFFAWERERYIRYYIEQYKYDNNKSFDEIFKIMHYDNMNHLATHTLTV